MCQEQQDNCLKSQKTGNDGERGETGEVRSAFGGCSSLYVVTHSKPGGWGGRRGEDWSIRLQPVLLPSHWGRSPVPPHYADHSSYTAQAPSPPGAIAKEKVKISSKYNKYAVVVKNDVQRGYLFLLPYKFVLPKQTNK